MRESATFLEIIFDLLVWGAIFLTLKPVINPPYYLESRKVNWACILMMVFCLFPFFGGDYFHYIENYQAAKNGHYAHIEEIYIWFIQNYCNSYHMFRLGVWGLALFLTIKAYKRLEINSQLAIFFFGVIYLPWFSYARASLAMACIFWGFSFWAKPINNNRLLSIIIGLSMMLLSIVFHRSAILGIICALGSQCFRNPKKKTIFFLSCLFPVGVYLLIYFLNQFMNIDLGYDDYISVNQRDNYLTGESSGGLSMGFGPYIMIFFARAPLLVVAIAYIYCACKGYFQLFSNSGKIVSSYAFILILLAFVFCIDLGYNTYTLYYRTLIFAHIPSAVFLSQMRSINCAPKLFKWIYYPSLFGVFYTLVYSAYCTLIR